MLRRTLKPRSWQAFSKRPHRSFGKKKGRHWLSREREGNVKDLRSIKDKITRKTPVQRPLIIRQGRLRMRRRIQRGKMKSPIIDRRCSVEPWRKPGVRIPSWTRSDPSSNKVFHLPSRFILPLPEFLLNPFFFLYLSFFMNFKFYEKESKEDRQKASPRIWGLIYIKNCHLTFHRL